MIQKFSKHVIFTFEKHSTSQKYFTYDHETKIIDFLTFSLPTHKNQYNPYPITNATPKQQ